MALVVITALWDRTDLYSRFDEFQVWFPLYIGLATAAVASFVGVVASKYKRGDY